MKIYRILNRYFLTYNQSGVKVYLTGLNRTELINKAFYNLTLK